MWSWEPGTTRNHKTFHAQAAQRQKKIIIKLKKVGGSFTAPLVFTWAWDYLDNQIKAQVKARKGEGRDVKEEEDVGVSIPWRKML
jgi:hypothetical protein